MPDARPVVVVTGALAPYTQVLYERIAAGIERRLVVLTCTRQEPSRRWHLAAPVGYETAVLPGMRWHRSTRRNLYVNPSVVTALRSLSPAVAILNDFAPTMAMAALAARALRIPYGVRTDGVPETDPRAPFHRALRRTVLSGAAFGLAPSGGSADLLESYGLARERIGRAPLFPAWEPPDPMPDPEERPYDVLFCGLLNEEEKGARFFTEVMRGCAAAGRRLSVRVVGEGPLKSEMVARLALPGITARFDGFLEGPALAEAYASARLFLFPTRGDVWGLVVNEALQCRMAVLASPDAGASRELLRDYGCGVVLPHDTQSWVAATLALLDDPERRRALRQAAAQALPAFSLEEAVAAYCAAVEPFVSSP